MTMSNNSFGMKIIPEGSGGSLTRWLVFLISQFVFGAALANLYLGMRGVMRLGGFVASGGPYEIAHPAPGWIWIMPVSIILGLICVFISFGAGHRLGGPNLMVLAWSALFISLGWNFLEFGFNPPVGEGLAWGWIIPGVIFIPMGALPLLIILPVAIKALKARKQRMVQAQAETGQVPKSRNWGVSLLLQLIAVALGVYLGIRFFENQAIPRQTEAPVQQTSRKNVIKKIPAGTPVVEFQNRGKTLTLISLPDGTWDIVYEGDVYERIRDLPRDIQKLFRNSLESVKGVKK